jgi:hypothetical protein
MGRRLLCVVLTAVLACSRPSDHSPAPAPSSAPSYAPDSPRASASVASAPSASAPTLPLIAVRLEARRNPKKPNALAWLVAPEIGFEERVEDVSIPSVCRLSPTPVGGAVTCSPDSQRVRAVVRRREGELVVERPSGTLRSVPIALDRSWTVTASEASERDLPDHACPADAPVVRNAEVQFNIHNNFSVDNIMQIVMPRERPRGILSLQLWRHTGSHLRCHSDGTPERRDLHCEGEQDKCVVTIEGASVVYTCTGPPAYEGRLLLPCGVRGKLTTSGLMLPSSTYN